MKFEVHVTDIEQRYKRTDKETFVAPGNQSIAMVWGPNSLVMPELTTIRAFTVTAVTMCHCTVVKGPQLGANSTSQAHGRYTTS